MAKCLHDDEDYPEALACLRTVYFQKPNYQARGLALDGDHGLLPHLLRHTLDLGEHGPPDWSFLAAEQWFADAHRALDAARYDVADKLLKHVLAWDPDNEVAHEQLAMIADARNDHAAAREHRLRRIEGFRRSLAEGPDDADLRDQFAEFLLQNNLLPIEALDHARKATELAPTVARYRRHLAECLAQLAQWASAVAEIHLANQLDPEDNDARELLTSYRRQLDAQTSQPKP
jgi:Tfp pilus assembly protein PilF